MSSGGNWTTSTKWPKSRAPWRSTRRSTSARSATSKTSKWRPIQTRAGSIHARPYVAIMTHASSQRLANEEKAHRSEMTHTRMRLENKHALLQEESQNAQTQLEKARRERDTLRYIPLHSTPFHPVEPIGDGLSLSSTDADSKRLTVDAGVLSSVWKGLKGSETFWNVPHWLPFDIREMLDGAQRMIATLKADPNRKTGVDAMRSHEVLIWQWLKSTNNNWNQSILLSRWRRTWPASKSSTPR